MVMVVMRPMRQKVSDEEHAAGLEPLHQPFGSEGRVVKVVEAHADARHVEVAEMRVAEGGWVGVVRHAEVAVVGDHFVLGETLGVGFFVSTCWPFGGRETDGQVGRTWFLAQSL